MCCRLQSSNTFLVLVFLINRDESDGQKKNPRKCLFSRFQHYTWTDYQS